MIFTEAPLAGAFTIGLEKREDARGHFARAFCSSEFAAHGLETAYVQANHSLNKKAGLVRGMHFQRGVNAEVKLVRCVRGAIYDVIVDNRPDSPNYLEWFGAELTEENGLMMYVPRGFAHGYQSLSDDAAAFYMVSTAYEPNAESGLRFDDPAIGIQWPMVVTDHSDKDSKWPLVER